MSASTVDVRDLSVRMPGAVGAARVLLSGVDLSLGAGESLAIVGESGSGKSLTARSLLALLPAGLEATGSIEVAGTDLVADPGSARALRGRRIALLMQDPFTMLNPLRRVGPQLADGLPAEVRRNRRRRREEVVRRLAEVGLDPDVARRYPIQLSGGMRQRVGIAAALAGDPEVLVADEPTTALDVTTQREILRLVRGIQHDRGMSFLLITHDLRVAFSMCDRVLVMYAGRIVEDLPAADLATRARHPYTRALVAAVPDMDTDLDRPLAVIPGRPVDPADVPAGCAYAARCPLATARCVAEQPPLETDAAGRRVACWHAGEPIGPDVDELAEVEAR